MTGHLFDNVRPLRYKKSGNGDISSRMQAPTRCDFQFVVGTLNSVNKR